MDLLQIDWLWKSVLARIVIFYLTPLGVGIGAFAKAKWKNWARPVLYGLVVTACLSMLYFTTTGHAIFAPTATDASNIDRNLQAWFAQYAVGAQPLTSAADVDIGYDVTTVNGHKVEVYRNKKAWPDYLRFQATMWFPEKDLASLRSLPQDEASLVMGALTSEALRNGLSYHADEGGPEGNVYQLKNVTVAKSVLIDGMTPVQCMDSVYQVENTMSPQN